MAGPKQPKLAAAPPPRLKVIVRRLPADLPEHIFNQSIHQWAPREVPEGHERVLTWSSYEKGKVRTTGRDDKHDIHSRAYLAFDNVDQLVAFHKAYNGWTFRDKQGNISHAVVEFAPYQKTPPADMKPDPRQNTIEEDPDYQTFLAALSQPAPAEPVEPTIDRHPSSTPLLDHLRALKAASRHARSAPDGPRAKPTRKSKLANKDGAATDAPGSAGPGGAATPSKRELKAAKAAAKAKLKAQQKAANKLARRQAVAAGLGGGGAAPPALGPGTFPALPGAKPLPMAVAAQYELARQQQALRAQLEQTESAVLQTQTRQRQLAQQQQQQQKQHAQREQARRQADQVRQQRQAHLKAEQQPKIQLLQNPDRATFAQPQAQGQQRAQAGSSVTPVGTSGGVGAAPTPGTAVAKASPVPNGQQQGAGRRQQPARQPSEHSLPNGGESAAATTGPKKSRRGGGGAKKAAAAAAAAAAAGGAPAGGSAPAPPSGPAGASKAPNGGSGGGGGGGGGVAGKPKRGRGNGGGRGNSAPPALGGGGPPTADGNA